jgi:hypothetical protein
MPYNEKYWVFQMQLPTVDSSEDALPPEEVRIRSVSTRVYEDRRRVRVSLELTPFQTPPDILVVIRDREGKELASTNIIGAMSTQIEFTIHLPGADTSSDCAIFVAVEYRERGRVHEVEKAFP